jgi:hypothetical protein
MAMLEYNLEEPLMVRLSDKVLVSHNLTKYTKDTFIVTRVREIGKDKHLVKFIGNPQFYDASNFIVLNMRAN